MIYNNDMYVIYSTEAEKEEVRDILQYILLTDILKRKGRRFYDV